MHTITGQITETRGVTPLMIELEIHTQSTYATHACTYDAPWTHTQKHTHTHFNHLGHSPAVPVRVLHDHESMRWDCLTRTVAIAMTTGSCVLLT